MPWFEVISREPWLLWTGTLLLGLIVGSFLNVVIYRLPQMMREEWQRECADVQGAAAPEAAGPRLTLSTPGSHCPPLWPRHHPAGKYPDPELPVPARRCSACAAPISLRYPLVEAMTALTLPGRGVALWARVGGRRRSGLDLGLVALSGIDLDTQFLPDTISLPCFWLGLLLSLVGLFSDPQASILGAAGGYLSLWPDLPSVPSGHRQGGHGLWGFQALGGLRCLAGMGGTASDCPVLGGGRCPGGGCPDLERTPGPRPAYPLRALLGCGGLDCLGDGATPSTRPTLPGPAWVEIELFSVALTGGIGSGKSTVADLFTALGAAVSDADAIAHALTAPGEPLVAEIGAKFGPGLVGPGGVLDRVALRRLVFADSHLRRQLEVLLHLPVRSYGKVCPRLNGQVVA